MFLLHLFSCQSSDEDRSSVPDDLDNLGRWEFRDVDFHVRIPVVPGPPGESSNGGNGVEPGEVQHTGIVDGTEGVKLCSSDVGLVFVVDSVFLEPVVDGGLEVDVVTEVSWSGTGHEELCLVGD